MQIKVLVAQDRVIDSPPESEPTNPLWFEMETVPRIGDNVWCSGVFGEVTGVVWEKSDEKGGVLRLIPCVTVLVP